MFAMSGRMRRFLPCQMNGEIYLEPVEGGKGTSFALLMPTGEIVKELSHG